MHDGFTEQPRAGVMLVQSGNPFAQSGRRDGMTESGG